MQVDWKCHSHILFWCSKLNILAFQYWQYHMSHIMTKPTKWHVSPAKIQISLGICPVLSESLLCTQWVAKDPSFLHAVCPGWSESWLGAHAILLVLSWSGSYNAAWKFPVFWALKVVRGNTNFSICAVHRANQLPYMQKWLSTKLIESHFILVDRQ